MEKNIKVREYEQNIMIDFIKKLKANNPEISFVLHNGFLDFGENSNSNRLEQFSHNFGTGAGINWVVETNGDFELPIIDDNTSEWYDSWQNNDVFARTTSHNEKEVKEKLSSLDVVEFNPGIVSDSSTYRTLIVGGKAKKIQKNKIM